MIGYLQLFAEPYVMTQGGPLHATTSLVLYMFDQGFRVVARRLCRRHRIRRVHPDAHRRRAAAPRAPATEAT